MPEMNDSLLSRKVINMVAKYANCKPEQISIETRIGEDLCIVGDDADELLTDFAEEFTVDMSGIDFNDYFPGESTANMHYYVTGIAKSKYQNTFLNFIRNLDAKFWKMFASRTDYETITIGELVNAANKGKW